MVCQQPQVGGGGGGGETAFFPTCDQLQILTKY